VIFEENNPSKVTACLENLLQLVLLDERWPSNKFVRCSRSVPIRMPISSQSIQSIIWSLTDHLTRLLSDNSTNYNLILQILLELNCYPIQPTYEQILHLAASFTDIHMKIIEEDDADLIDHLLLWRDALLNVIHFNNQEFQLFVITTLIDFLIPKLTVR
jgi:hypothetical protein